MKFPRQIKSLVGWGIVVGWLGAVSQEAAQAQVGSTSRSVGSTISGGNRSAFSGSSGGTGSSSGGSLLSQLGNTGVSSGASGISRSSGTFIGADSSDATFVGASAVGGGTGMRSGSSSFGGLGGMSSFNGGFGGLSGLGGFGANSRGGIFGSNNNNRNRSNMNNRMGANSRQINVRTQLDVGFRYSQRPTVRTETTLVKMLNSKRIARTGDLQVQVENGTATLMGRVATRADRDLAVRIAKQEPGVQTVLDQLVVESPDEDALSPSDAR